ncbi:MAG: dihydrofolate synthase/folylpolyglutamate synthase [Vicingaceae bacterium]
MKANKLGYLGRYFNTVNEALFAAKENQQPSDIIYVGGSNFVVAEII